MGATNQVGKDGAGMKNLYRCIVTTTETTYVKADCEEDVKEMAICGQVNSVAEQQVFVSDIEKVGDKND